MTNENPLCWLCGSDALQLVKASNIPSALASHSFSITDSNYGITGVIFRCRACGFMECPDLREVLPFYENLVDTGYEIGRKERGLQARKILEGVRKFRVGGRLLDIGAGSGILVEQALELGYRAQGIEPSKWLQKTAADRGLPVSLGTFPHPEVCGPFDVVTLIDVIEHVSNPVELLCNIRQALKQDGLAVIVTPDVSSIAARILSWKWWHFRIAHIGYFNKRTLLFALGRAGLKPVLVRRPAWFFTADYLWVRVQRYLPRVLRIPPPNFATHLVIPLNLRDSWLIACRRSTSGSNAR
jgi:SAM-dependent methyltransferase